MTIDIQDPKLKSILRSVRQPSRYIGGETGSIIKSDQERLFKTAICFPDLYEIGMSNQAVRILYEGLNRNPDIVCERLFAPAPDFREALKEASIPLFTLESGIDAGSLDVIAFTLGSELALTTVLGVLEASGIPLLAADRKEGDPVIIAGGPAATNPAPFGAFFDGIFMGEFEESGEALFSDMAAAKKEGLTPLREGYIALLNEFQAMWTSESTPSKRAVRALWQGFKVNRDLDRPPLVPYFAVQNHGVIEIMRGCPNNCRFCHAGIYYNPCREKEIEDVLEEAEYLVTRAGFRELTLSSLSTGDYSNLIPLTRLLNERFKHEAVTLSLPSLRVSSFTLDLLEGISKGRKSGLTFAVETPEGLWQQSLNKEVGLDRVIEILQGAVSRGWSLAKFYFMIGLPASIKEDEAAAIIDFVKAVKQKVKIRININVGTFIPKAHTAFQWAPQLPADEAGEKLRRIKQELKALKVKVSYHDPHLSWLEGLLSRGSEEMSNVILAAYRNGAYLDPWEEHFNKEAWKEALTTVPETFIDKMKNGYRITDKLPWDSVSMRSSKKFLTEEYHAAMECRMTGDCETECNLNCGVCGKKNHIQRSQTLDEEKMQQLIEEAAGKAETINRDREGLPYKMVLNYTKEGKSSWISHRALSGLFERMFVISSLNLNYSKGFNPKPRQEFASPLPVGAEGSSEWTSIEILLKDEVLADTSQFSEQLLAELNSLSISGIEFRELMLFPIEPNRKKVKLMPAVSGYDFEAECHPTAESEVPKALEALQALFQRCSSIEVEEDPFSDLNTKNCFPVRFRINDASINPFKLIEEEELNLIKLKRVAVLASKKGSEQKISMEEYLKDF